MAYKRRIIIGFAIVAMVLLATLAYAGWGGCCGYLYFGSLKFHWELQGGAKPESTAVLSTGHITEIAVTCMNRGGNFATAWAPRDVLTSVNIPVTNATVDENGKITIEGEFPDTWSPDNPDTLCPNEQNWDAVGPVVPSTLTWFVSVQTTNKNGVKVWDQESYVCTYQGPYPAPEGGDGMPEDDYECILQ